MSVLFPLRNLLTILLACVLFQSCLVLPFIVKNSTYKAPDYSKRKYWSALPQKRDSADAIVPNSGLKNNQQNAHADVFFIHPTTYLWGRKWNADVEDTSINGPTDRHSIKFQASVFNGSCKVYVPRYRLAEFFTYFAPRHTQERAFNLAYSDIKRAFEYYLKHYNNGRPFIIASHSQGTDHAIRLCKEVIENDSALRTKLVAAYLIGTPISKETFKSLPVCDSASQINCFVTWNCVRWGELTFYGRPVLDAICVNPLTWTTNKEHAPANLNKGSLPAGFNRLDSGFFDARIAPNGLLWIHKPKVSKRDYPTINSRSYHILDYNLFYMNIRENVNERIKAYLKMQNQLSKHDAHR